MEASDQVPISWDVQLVNKASLESELRLCKEDMARRILTDIWLCVRNFREDYPTLPRRHRHASQQRDGLLVIRDERAIELPGTMYEPLAKHAIVIKRHDAAVPEATMKDTARILKIFTMTPVVATTKDAKGETTKTKQLVAVPQVKVEIPGGGPEVQMPAYCPTSFEVFYKQKVTLVPGTWQVLSVGSLKQIQPKLVPSFSDENGEHDDSDH